MGREVWPRWASRSALPGGAAHLRGVALGKQRGSARRNLVLELKPLLLELQQEGCVDGGREVRGTE